MAKVIALTTFTLNVHELRITMIRISTTNLVLSGFFSERLEQDLIQTLPYG